MGPETGAGARTGPRAEKVMGGAERSGDARRCISSSSSEREREGRTRTAALGRGLRGSQALLPERCCSARVSMPNILLVAAEGSVCRSVAGLSLRAAAAAEPEAEALQRRSGSSERSGDTEIGAPASPILHSTHSRVSHCPFLCIVCGSSGGGGSGGETGGAGRRGGAAQRSGPERSEAKKRGIEHETRGRG